MKTRISAIVAICCLAVVTPAFGKKKKGKGGDNQPASEEVTPPKTDGGTGIKPTTDAGTTPPTATPPADAGATALPTAPPPLTGNLTTLSGKTYVAVALKRVDPDGLLIVHRSGETKVLLADLPENLRTRYYAAKVLAAFQAAQAAEAERKAKDRAAVAEKRAEEKKKNEQLKSAVRITGTVFQMVKDGIIVKRYGWTSTPAKGRARDLFGGDDLVFITGHKRQDTKVDGDPIDVDAIRDGMFSYTTTSGGGKRLAKYEVLKK